MRTAFTIVAGLAACLLVDPALAASLQIAKVYRDYPGYINPAVCENPNVSKPPAASPNAQIIVVPVPVTVEPAVSAPELPPNAETIAEPAPIAPAASITAPATAVGDPVPVPAVEAPATVPSPVVAPATSPVAPSVLAPLPVAVDPVISAPVPVAETLAEPTPIAPAASLAAPATAAGASLPIPAIEVPATVPGPVDAPAAPPTSALPVAADPPLLCDPASARMPADSPDGAPYLAAWAGLVMTHDVDVDGPDANGEVPFDNGYGGGVAFGYDFGSARLEIEGSYRNSNAEEGDADLKVRALMVNAYADFDTGGLATPYLGAGVGAAEVDIEGHDDEVLAGQVAAGILFVVAPQVSLDLGYRFMMTDDPEIDGYELEVRQHTALLGVQIKF